MVEYLSRETRELLIKVATSAGVPHDVYAAAADALHWTRKFSKRECAEMLILDELRYSLVPMLETFDEANDPEDPIHTSLRLIKERLKVLEDPES